MVALSNGEPGLSSLEVEDHEYAAAASAAAETSETRARDARLYTRIQPTRV
jgi:hypothetical protein